MAGISVARQFCRKTYITSTTRAMASISVTTTSWIDRRMKVVLSIGSPSFLPGGRAAGPSLRVGRRHEGHAGGGPAVVKAIEAVGIRSQFDAGDIGQVHDSAAGCRLQDDV